MTLRRHITHWRLPFLSSLAIHLFCLAGGVTMPLPLAPPVASLRAVLVDGRKDEVAEQSAPAPPRQYRDGRRVADQSRLASPVEKSAVETSSAQPSASPRASGLLAEATAPREAARPAGETAVPSTPEAESVSVDGLRQYRLALAREARRLKRYPPLAREHAWEGTAQIAAVFSGAAEPAVALAHSSGHAVLDEQALIMIARAVQSADLPDSLRGRQFKLLVPVQFSLGD